MFISRKRYELRCCVEMLDTIEKYFPNVDTFIEAADGMYTASFCPYTDTVVNMELSDFTDKKANLFVRCVRTTRSISDAPDIIDTFEFCEDIETFFIHFKTTMALQQVGIIKTNKYKELLKTQP